MSPKEKASSFLSSLRAGGGGGGGGGGLFGGGGAPAAADPKLQSRIAELEKRLEELSKSVLPPADGEPPRAPTDLMLFLQTRMELLEQKLQAAQEEAIRANLLLREREQAQRKAQSEVEQLFRTIREQTRAASYDGRLREEFSAAQRRITELEERLGPGAKAEAEAAAFAAVAGQAKPVIEERLEAQKEDVCGAPAPPAEAQKRAADAATWGLVMGRLADLEQRLEQASTERDQEKARRIVWEKQVFAELIRNPERFERTGGHNLLVEAAVQHAVRAVTERDQAAEEVRALLKRIESEPADSKELVSLRAKLMTARAKMEESQQEVLKHSALLQAWMSKGQIPIK